MSSLSGHLKPTNVRTRQRARPAVAGDVSPLILAIRSRLRFLRRRLDGIPAPRAGTGSALALTFIFGGWFYGAIVGGTAPVLISGIGTGFGLQATQVVLTGQVETSERDMMEALAMGQALGPGSSLLGYDAASARKNVLALPWVKDVAIRKLYPGKLTVAVVEKKAAAVWQHKDRLTVVEQTGLPIAKFGISDLLNNRFSHLPHLVGEGASKSASEILPAVSRHAILSSRVVSYTRVANRRWDIGLANGMQVLLPEGKVQSALAKLAELAGSHRLLDRSINVVDMRLQDRIVLRLSPEAAEARATVVAARGKAMKELDRKL